MLQVTICIFSGPNLAQGQGTLGVSPHAAFPGGIPTSKFSAADAAALEAAIRQQQQTAALHSPVGGAATGGQMSMEAMTNLLTPHQQQMQRAPQTGESPTRGNADEKSALGGAPVSVQSSVPPSVLVPASTNIPQMEPQKEHLEDLNKPPPSGIVSQAYSGAQAPHVRDKPNILLSGSFPFRTPIR